MSPTSENIHTKGTQTWRPQTENNAERSESFVLRQPHFSVNDDNATAWNILTVSSFMLHYRRRSMSEWYIHAARYSNIIFLCLMLALQTTFFFLLDMLQLLIGFAWTLIYLKQKELFLSVMFYYRYGTLLNATNVKVHNFLSALPNNNYLHLWNNNN
jgi:hypothetical protein